MKELLLQFAAYNVWANQKMLETILSLDKKIQHRNVASSFSSLQLTLQHLMYVESIWWQRLKLTDAPLPVANASMPVSEIGTRLIASSNQWKEWIEKTAAPSLEHVFEYRNSKKEQFKQPVYQMLLHLFNHQTYHRGQLATMLRQVGVEQIPGTDFILWSRAKK